MSPDAASLFSRVLGFIALFQASGAAIFLLLFGRTLAKSATTIRSLGMVAAIGGILLLLVHQLIEAARMADDWSGVFEADLQAIAWTSSNAAFHEGAVVGLTLVAVGLARRLPPSTRIALLGSIIAVCAFLLTGHSSVHRLRWFLAPLLGAHLLIVAFWFGALLPLYLLCQKESLAIAADVVRRFSAIAIWLVPTLAAAGLLMAIVLSSADVAVLTRPYGQLLSVKLAAFGLLMSFAAYNKWRLTPALSDGKSAALRGLRRAIAAEYLIIVAVLAVTAILTMYYSPEGNAT